MPLRLLFQLNRRLQITRPSNIWTDHWTLQCVAKSWLILPLQCSLQHRASDPGSQLDLQSNVLAHDLDKPALLCSKSDDTDKFALSASAEDVAQWLQAPEVETIMSSFAQPLTSPLSGLPPTALWPSFLLPLAFRCSAQ